MRKLVHKVIAHERLVRLSHSHTFQAGHHTAHILYLVSIACEGFSIHSVMGGVMCVCSIIALLGGEELT